MAELFGAPLGIIAKEEGNRAELGFGLKALHTLGEVEKQRGEIAAQPADRALKEANARWHNSQALKNEQEAAAEESLNRIQAQFAEQEARQALQQAAHAEGRELTANDITPEGAVAMLARPRSQADSLERFSNFAKTKGVSPIKLAKIDETVAKIKGSEAAAGWRESQADHMKFLEESARREKLGGVAAAMAANPQNFAQGMMDPEIRKMLPKELPLNYAAAKQTLEFIAQSSLKAQQAAQEQRARVELGLKKQRAEAAISASRASAGAAGARANLSRERLTVLKKYGGPNAEASIDAKHASAAASRSATTARDAANFPQAPLDPSTWTADQQYTAPDGRRFVARVNPATKKMAMQFLGAPAKVPAAAMNLAGPENDEGDEGSDDMDDGED